MFPGSRDGESESRNRLQLRPTGTGAAREGHRVITAKARPHELTALLASLDEVGPDALTACPGWTAHHLAAHIAGNYAEVRRHLNAFAAGEPLTTTRSWE
jgi:hypothetical protein